MKAEFLFFWLAVVFYGLSSFSYIFGLIAKKEKLFSLGLALGAVGFAGNLAAVALRWIEGGVLPFIETSESLISGVLVAMIIFLVLQLARKQTMALGVLVMPVLFILLGWAGTMIREISGQLPAALQSAWLWVHIIGASVGFGSVLVASGAGLLYLLKEKRPGGIYDRLPDLPALDILGYRFVTGGFIMLGLMLISGAFWSNQVHGKF